MGLAVWMKSALLAACAIALIAIPREAATQDSGMMLTGADFLSACTRADADWISFCNGYVQAVFDGIRRPGEDFCPPAGTTRTMIVEAVVAQLEAAPDLLDLNAASVVYAVLLKAFPCQ